MSAPEFARPVRIDTIGEPARPLTIEADAVECAALAVRFGLIALDRLAATVTLVREGETIRADGRIEAQVVQACIASGEPVPQEIAEDFALRFAPEAEEGADEIELDADALDTLPLEGSTIDLGEAVAQTLALALDPYPRAPDADMRLREVGVGGESETGPFAALRQLRDLL